jgi:hypothetical protein
MNENKRKHIRRPLSYPARIDAGDGSPPRECLLNDVSEEGAQIAVAAPQELPDNFTLILGFDGTARRRCRMMWRSENRIGVKFIRDPSQAKAKPVQSAAADGAPPEAGAKKAAVGK